MDNLKSLEKITTGYAVFEKDQVLTHDQLNGVADYLDDQTRLERVNLLGVGLVCGLRVLQSGGMITLGKGVGVTTDGDLLSVSVEKTYDRFIRYDESKPVYRPFYVKTSVNGEQQESMIPVYEMVATTDTGTAGAMPLARFTTETKIPQAEMVAVLFMESYVTDRDICSGTDCDNLGQDRLNTIKLLLVEKRYIGLLKARIDTPHGAFALLNEIVVDRPLIGSSINTTNKLAQTYRRACGLIQAKLAAELSIFYSMCAPFLADAFPADPGPAWLGRLADIKTKFDNSDAGIQYYYDFLKDLAETYNGFRELLCNDATLCSPSPELFPKHLLLGNLVPGADPEENRTILYPSPAISCSAGQLQHAKFLLNKITTMIRIFQVPAATGPLNIHITPGMWEEHPLEERAIPCYYPVDETTQIYRKWNYRLHLRGMDNRNYSCNAAAYGGPVTPLAAQIGRFRFFRIEGHLGRNAHDAFTAIEAEIKKYNLPITVHAVLLGTDHSKIIKKPGIRYTDLHRFHYLLRQDVAHQLGEVVTFSQNFKQKIGTEVRKNTINDTEQRGIELKSISKEHNTIIARNASAARGKLNGNYSSYSADVSWQQHITPAIQSAGKFRTLLSDVVKTEFATPFDTLVSGTHIQWLGWLDDIIRARDVAEDGKRLFANFLTEHPGVEHFAGVERGGTFVLVYDEGQDVVADFMLPYYLPEVKEEEPPEPPLKKPGFKPPWIVGNGISVLPSRDKYVKTKLEDFKAENLGQFVKTDNLESLVQNKFADLKADFKFDQVEKIQTKIQEQFNSQQKEYLTAMKDTVSLMGNALVTTRSGKSEAVSVAAYTDVGLNEKMTAARTKRQVVTYLQEKTAAKPELKDKYSDLISEAENDLAVAISDSTKYVAEKNLDVSMGSEGFAAMMEINSGAKAIKEAAAFETVTKTITSLQKQTGLRSGFSMSLSNLGRK
jgi:hypothetical protein